MKYLLILGILTGFSISILGFASGTYISAEEEMVEIPMSLLEENRTKLFLSVEPQFDFYYDFDFHLFVLSKQFNLLLSEQINRKIPLIDIPYPPPEG